MESALSIWERRRDEPWIIGFKPEFVRGLLETRQGELSSSNLRGCVSITAEDPLRFSVEFLAALTHDKPLQVFLGPAPKGAAAGDRTRVMVATGGTTGKPRYAVHTWESLAAAACGLQEWLGGGPIVSVCLLPMRHTSGLMQLIRAFVSGGRILFSTGQDLEAGNVPNIPEGAVTSLVPTQLAHLLDVPSAVKCLEHFRMIFVGGGPIWPDLLNRAREAKLPIALCYGMTETAAQIATQSPDQFIVGAEPCVEILPHAEVEIVDAGGMPVPAGTPGRIRIKSAALFRGYWPDVKCDAEWFLSDDQGAIDSDGCLRILGRVDTVIITGGEKVEPAEIENALRATGLVNDVAVLGVPDNRWGQIIAAVIVCDEPSLGQLPRLLSEVLDSFKIPKRWRRVESLPRDNVGKIDRQALQAIASEL